MRICMCYEENLPDQVQLHQCVFAFWHPSILLADPQPILVVLQALQGFLRVRQNQQFPFVSRFGKHLLDDQEVAGVVSGYCLVCFVVSCWLVSLLGLSLERKMRFELGVLVLCQDLVH